MTTMRLGRSNPEATDSIQGYAARGEFLPFVPRAYKLDVQGFDSRANCALSHSPGKLVHRKSFLHGSYFKSPILIKQNDRAARALPFHLVRMTGFEPTRLATLEPDGNDTSVELSPCFNVVFYFFHKFKIIF